MIILLILIIAIVIAWRLIAGRRVRGPKRPCPHCHARMAAFAPACATCGNISTPLVDDRARMWLFIGLPLGVLIAIIMLFQAAHP